MIAVPKPTPRTKEPQKLKGRPRAIPADVKRTVFARDDFTCQWCKVPGGALDAHHRLRRSQGGRDVLHHLVSAHRVCHDQIHREPEEARRRGFLVRSEDELAKGWH